MAATLLTTLLEYERDFEGQVWVDWARDHAEIPIFAVCVYIATVFRGADMLEKYTMELDLRALAIVWNALLALFSIVGTTRTLPHLLRHLWREGFGYTVCTDPKVWFLDGPVGLWVALLVFSKIPELMDTVCLLFRKRKVIFLHWFHHCTVLLYCWHAYRQRVATGLWFVSMNFLVHSIMYTYYAAVAVGMRSLMSPCALVITLAHILQMAVGALVTIFSARTHAAGGFQACAVDAANYKLGFGMYCAYFILFSMLFYKKYIGCQQRPSGIARVQRQHELCGGEPTAPSARYSGQEGGVDDQTGMLRAVVETLLAFVLQALVQWSCFLSRMGSWALPFCRRHHEAEFEDEAEKGDSHTGPSVAFSGCAFYWPYMAGVCQYLYEEFELTDVKMYSTSASTFPVVCAMLGVNPLNWCMVDYPRCLAHWYARPLLCFVDSTAFLRQLWHNFLPADAYKTVEDRLVVSVTRLELGYWGLPILENERVSSFHSNADLVDTLMATINMPGFFFRGLPKWRGKLTVDGAYSERTLRPGGKTVVVTSLPGSAPSDLRPSKPLPWLWMLLPQPMERTKQMMRLGYEDARANRCIFENRGWRAKAAGPADSTLKLG